MNDSNKTGKIAVVGGDARQEHLARVLAADEYEVSTYGIDTAVFSASPSGTFADAAESCRAVIFPVKPKESINEHIKMLNGGAVVFSWSPSCELVSAINERGCESFDLAADEALTIKNACLTAEGALSLFMNETSSSVAGSDILVIGSGRVARCVCSAFSALGARVTMMARSKRELVWAEVSGWRRADLKNEPERLAALAARRGAVINTVPARTLDGASLDKIRPGTLFIDLASAPYGIEEDEASARGIKLIRAGGLPGKYAPASSAEIIADCVRRKLEGGAT